MPKKMAIEQRTVQPRHNRIGDLLGRLPFPELDNGGRICQLMCRRSATPASTERALVGASGHDDASITPGAASEPIARASSTASSNVIRLPSRSNSIDRLRARSSSRVAMLMASTLAGFGDAAHAAGLPRGFDCAKQACGAFGLTQSEGGPGQASNRRQRVAIHAKSPGQYKCLSEVRLRPVPGHAGQERQTLD